MSAAAAGLLGVLGTGVLVAVVPDDDQLAPRLATGRGVQYSAASMATIRGALEASYLVSSLRQVETRVAAVVVLSVSLCVGALSRVPLKEGLVIDFRENDRSDGTAQATPSGFGLPLAEGRRNAQGVVRIVTNRPLPERFALWLDGRWVSPAKSGTLEIRVGDSRKRMRLGPTESLQGVRLENPTGARDIEIEVGAGRTFSVRRLTVTVDGVDALPPDMRQVDPRAAGGGGTLFFLLLALVTALPFALLPVSREVLPNSAALGTAVSVVAFMGAGGHVGASFFFYSDPKVRRFMLDGRFSRYLVVPAAAIVAFGALFCWGEGAKAYGIVGFWIWQVHHFTRQNHGILAFVSRASGVAVARAERIAIVLSGVGAILATLTYVTPLGETLFARYRWHLYATGCGTFVCACLCYLLSNPLRDLKRAPLRGLLLFCLSAFYLPLFLFRDAYLAVYTYLFAHGLQYFVFMHFVARTPRPARARSLAILAGLTLAVGGSFRWLQANAYNDGQASVFLGIQLGVTVWHFVLDAGVWRLSEPFQREYIGERFAFLRSAPIAE